jgi:hypothetical protein
VPDVPRHRDARRESVRPLLDSARTAPRQGSRRVSAVDLETRVANRKRELIAEAIEHKKNSCRFGAAEAVDRIKERLSELAYIVKESVVDGWANVDPKATHRFDEWISK